MRAWLKKVLFRRGGFVAEATPLPDLASTLQQLKPLDIGVPLIRMGPVGDGGYLVPDDLAGVKLAMSAGVAGEWGFEQMLRDNHAIDSVLIDRVEGEECPPFPTDDAWLGSASATRVLSLSDWMAKRAPASGDLILQMDIEGAEWMTLASTPRDLLCRFRILVIEFHGLHRSADRMTHDELIAPLLRKLSADFVCAHIHANNAMGVDSRTGIDIPYLLEVTWWRRDRLVSTGGPVSLPRPDDCANDPTRPEIRLSSFWTS